MGLNSVTLELLSWSASMQLSSFVRKLVEREMKPFRRFEPLRRESMEMTSGRTQESTVDSSYSAYSSSIASAGQWQVLQQQEPATMMPHFLWPSRGVIEETEF
jgi:hypothetical protein